MTKKTSAREKITEFLTEHKDKFYMKLIQTEKLAALGQLVAGVAHEINNPITFIYLNLQMVRKMIEQMEEIINSYGEVRKLADDPEKLNALLDRIDDDLTSIRYRRRIDKTFQLLSGITTGVERTMKIIEGLRNFSRLDPKKKESVDVREGIETTLDMIRHKLQREGEVEVRCPATVPHVLGYPGALNQVFLNLLVNAAEATEDSKGRKRVEVTIAESGKNVVVTITDCGGGIPQDIKPKIFEPFYTTKRDQKGVGLGLSISYGIIEDHDGVITLKSPVAADWIAEGCGTEFTVKLPRYWKTTGGK